MKTKLISFWTVKNKWGYTEAFSERKKAYELYKSNTELYDKPEIHKMTPQMYFTEARWWLK